MSLDKLKLSKPLITAMTDAGYLTPKEIQAKTMSRILGGQDILAVGPEGSGKTTAYILGVLMRLKYTKDDAPKVLILVADKDRAIAVIDQFISLSKNRDLNIVGLYGTGGVEAEVNELVLGIDIVVATPTRARAIYLKLGLNLSKLQTFIVDDAALIVQQGMQLPVCELARSAGKCQHLVFTEVIHEKLTKMTDQFLNFPTVIEVEDFGDTKTETVTQVLYQVPNYKTKINLLRHLLRDDEVFDKVVVFVNSRLTAQKLAISLASPKEMEFSMFRPLHFDENGFDDFEDFKQTPEARVLVVANQGEGPLNLDGIPFIFHFDVPEEKETFLSRIIKNKENPEEVVAITFATDMELVQVKKIEQSIGQKLELMDLPEELLVEKTLRTKGLDKNRIVKVKSEEPAGGGAYHEKKESNSKNYNYGIGQKAKMTMKKKHS
ncbi:ATP-dependent RNA helicase RhlE [Pedobacter cryoconitis]|uniref:ATP-dependent RNA helicase RhlE n=1 Tax=Pedobacter cryoconitis TaxID=188932 RepID=A0A7W8ZSC8_9SPHI|nr:DEAD/DEAH box helicase [Pedobacter cryoconitis]MBB5639180.1 ATP-dependent RNA helicase RhlE [Pedobacter cryoconitis]